MGTQVNAPRYSAAFQESAWWIIDRTLITKPDTGRIAQAPGREGAEVLAKMLNEHVELSARVQDLATKLDLVCKGYVETEEGLFTFPDGESWDTKKRKPA